MNKISLIYQDIHSNDTCQAEVMTSDSAEEVWNKIKQFLDSYYHHEFNKDSFESVCWLFNHTKVSKDTDKTDGTPNYYINIYAEPTIVVLKAFHKECYEQGIVAYENRYVFSNNEGNCIDDFIHRGLNPQLANIDDLIQSIKERLPERQTAIEYHQTSCYEKDFAQISLIRNFAQKIVDNCNKHLERISEFYTKL